MDFITYVEQNLKEALPGIMAGYEGEIKAGDLSAMEKSIKEVGQAVGKEIIEWWLEAQESKYAPVEQACQCGGQAKYVRRRRGVSITLQGRVSYRRAYYLCPECGRGYYPLDKRLGIKPGEMSDEVVKQAALLGVQDAFGAAQETLKELTLLDLSHSSIHKASQMMGAGVIAAEEALKQRSQDFDSQLEQRRSQQKPERLYGSMDGFMVPLEDGWHEMKVGAWWTARTRRDGSLAAQDIHYYVDRLPAEEFSDLVWATGFAHQADQAQELVFVADGADWIWRIVNRHYPQAIQIVDWYHACQYIAPVAQLAFKDPAQREDWIEQVTGALWNGDLDTVISACALYIRPDLKPTDDPARKAVTYYTNNRHRMHYPAYRDQNLMLGSGSMESGCKQLGLERLTIAGARWSPDGARLLAKARAAYLSQQWSAISPCRDALPIAA
jgi:hypothetical protein